MLVAAMGEARLAQASPRPSGAPNRKLNPGPGMPAAEVAAHQTARLHKATIEVVSKHGYSGAKVREISRLAGVSTRAFYEHFGSKQDCVLQTYDLVVRRATRRIIASQADEPDWRERVSLVFDAFTNELKSAPSAGRFALVEIPAARPIALEQVRRRAEDNFEALLAESLARAPMGVVTPPPLIEGVVAGVAHVTRSRLAGGGARELSKVSGELVDWALQYLAEPASELEELDMRLVPENGATEWVMPSLNGSGNGASSATADRALILAAAVKLVVSHGYRNLTVPRIRAAAGVSRRTFDSHFESVEDCVVTALDQRAREVLSQAALAQVSSRTWSGGIYRAMVVLCEQMAADRFLASVCLTDDFDSGSRGAQCRHRLIAAAAEQVTDSIPSRNRPSKLTIEATEGAIWGLVQNHVLKDWPQRPRLAATLSYLVLAPALGPSGAVTVIRQEQQA